MRVNAEALNQFYSSPLGCAAQDMIQRRVAALWPQADGLDVLGFGHAQALLEPYRAGARRVISASPEGQGVKPWPKDAKRASVLVDEGRLPFMDSVFDRILLLHGLEEAEGPRRLLRELWRVAAPECRLLVVVAHRGGLWARAEATPFGFGQPYTRSQLNALLDSAVFEPTAWARALYAPPLNWRVVTSAAETWEQVGRWGWPGFGGVLMIEAVKRLHVQPGAVKATARRATQAAQAQPIMSGSKRETDMADGKTLDVPMKSVQDV